MCCSTRTAFPSAARKIVLFKDLARTGSANHRLLVELMAQGARLVGTESPDLLIEEYELNRQLLLDRSTGVQDFESRIQALSRDLLDRRDAFVARRIDETLAPGQIGCLFLGLMHSLEGHSRRDLRDAPGRGGSVFRVSALGCPNTVDVLPHVPVEDAAKVSANWRGHLRIPCAAAAAAQLDASRVILGTELVSGCSIRDLDVVWF